MWENTGIAGKASWLYMLLNDGFLIRWRKFFILKEVVYTFGLIAELELCMDFQLFFSQG